MAPISTISLKPGADPVHITVEDQSGRPLPPSALSWVLDPTASGLVAIAPDASGFNFSVADGAADISGAATVTYAPNGVSLTVPLIIASPVTSLQLVSP